MPANSLLRSVSILGLRWRVSACRTALKLVYRSFSMLENVKSVGGWCLQDATCFNPWYVGGC